MKYIDKFANIDAFLNSELRNITGDRVAVIEGFNLPILKKKPKMVVDPSTNEEVEELQDVWAVPVGQEEKKVQHDYTFTLGRVNAKDLKSFDFGDIEIELCDSRYFYLDGQEYQIRNMGIGMYTNIFYISRSPLTVKDNNVPIDISDAGTSYSNGAYGHYTNGLGQDLAYNLYPGYSTPILNTPYEYSINQEFSSESTTSRIPLHIRGSVTIKPEGYFSSSDDFQLKIHDDISHIGIKYWKYENGVLDVFVPDMQVIPVNWQNNSMRIGIFTNEDHILYGNNQKSYTGTICDVEGTVKNSISLTVQIVSSGWITIDNFRETYYSLSDNDYFEVDLGKIQIEKRNSTDFYTYTQYVLDYPLVLRVHKGTGLDELVLPEGTTSIDQMVLNSAGYDQAANRPTKFAIPEGVTEIKSDAFWGWNIEEISFPSSLQFVGNRAFRLWKSTGGMSSVTLPAGCKYFDQSFGQEYESFDVMEQDPTTMMSTYTPMTVTGGQVYSQTLSGLLSTDQKQTLINNSSSLTSSIWNSIDSQYYDNIQNKVTIVDFDNIFPQAGDSVDPMTQPSLYLYGANYLFSGWNLIKEVRFPSYTQGYLGESVFNGCKNLSSVSGIDNITEIGNNCFQNTAFQSFTLPASVSTIKQNAFRWESNDEAPLTSFTIPSNSMLTKIEGNAFAGQINLMSITLPASCKYMANSFPMLTYITGGVQAWDMHDPNHYGQIVEDGTTEITYGQFQNNSSDFQYGVSYYLPSSVTTIGGWAFNNTQNLANISLHEGITSIGDQSFANLYSLNTITLPSTLTYLGSGAFWNDNQLSVIFPASWNVTSIPENCFSGCNFSNSKNITLPSGITSIGNNAFKNCQIESVVIPSTVTSIGSGAFAGTHLTAVTLPNGCTWYETSFPAGCTVTSDTVSTPIVANLADKNASGVLGTDWFQMNYGYDYICTKVIIPEGVTGLQTYGSSWFSYNTKDFIKEVQLPTTIDGTQVGVGAFSDMSALETIDVSNFISISERLFEGDSNLFKNTAPTFAAGLLTIGNNAFKGTMKNVTTLDLSRLADLQTIGYNSFAGTGLTSVTLPTGVVYYPNSFPAGCTVTGGTLTTYDETNVKADAGIDIWPEGATSITSDPLSGPTGQAYKNKITNLTVPASIQVIGPSVFANMPNLIDVHFQHTHEPLEIQNSAFNYCGLRSLSIPAGCTSIGEDAFRGSADLTTISFVSSKGEHDLTTIGKNAFKDTGLTSVTLPAASNASYWPNSFPAGCTVTGGSMVDNTIHLSGGIVQSQYNWQSTYTKAVIDSDVTGFGYARVFEGHETLAEVVFNNEMEGLRIGENMFAQCPFLKTVTFNGGYVIIGNNAFAETALTSVTLPAGSSYQTDSFPAGCTVTVATAE